MNRLKGKNVLITGASNGIGKACALKFAESGANIILMARNKEALTILEKNLKEEFGSKVYVIIADVREYDFLKKSLETLPEEFKNIDILVNNAGLAIGMDKVYENQAQEMDNVLDTNIKGVLYMCQLVVPKMLENKTEGTIINMGSIAGNAAYAGGAVYCATKAAVKTISDGLRIDLVDKPIRVTTVLPGMVETEFSIVRFKGDAERAKNVYKGIEALTPMDIADTVVYIASLPQNVQINDIVMTPIHQANATTIYKI